MNRFQPREGTPAPYWRHMVYIADSVDNAFRSAFADYLALAQDFFVEGAVITPTPSGTSTTYAITAGHVVYKGEFMPVDAHSITKLASQVVYMEVNDVAVDVAPVLNVDGNTDYVLRRRTARLRVGSVYPMIHMAITAPRKADLDRLRLKGRLIVPGMIMPYAGDMGVFDGTGLGIADSSMEGWAVCNGLNGTIDMRGLMPLGATDVPDSGASAVEGIVNGNSTPGDLYGADLLTIGADNLPEHTHPYIDNLVSYGPAGPVPGGGTNGDRPDFARTTDVNVTPNNPIDVRSASRALVYVQSIG